MTPASPSTVSTERIQPNLHQDKRKPLPPLPKFSTSYQTQSISPHRHQLRQPDVLTRSTGTFLTRAPINVISTSNLNLSPTPSTACFPKPSNASAAAAKSTKTVGLCRYLDEVSDLVDNQGLKEDDPKINKQYEKNAMVSVRKI